MKPPATDNVSVKDEMCWNEPHPGAHMFPTTERDKPHTLRSWDGRMDDPTPLRVPFRGRTGIQSSQAGQTVLLPNQTSRQPDRADTGGAHEVEGLWGNAGMVAG